MVVECDVKTKFDNKKCKSYGYPYTYLNIVFLQIQWEII